MVSRRALWSDTADALIAGRGVPGGMDEQPGHWQPNPQATTPPGAVPQALAENQARSWALGAHISALAGFLVPFGNILGPLIVWLLKKDQSPFVDDQGKEALNFQIFVSIIMLALGVLFGIGVLLTIVLIGALLVPLVAIAMLVVAVGAAIFAIIGGVKANEGVAYRYPWTMRFIK